MEPNSVYLGGPETDEILSIMNLFQRGRIEEQRCTLGPCKSDPATPTKTKANLTGRCSDEFFHALAKIQSQRLDDQRLSLASLPGFNQKDSRNDAHRCSAPQIILTESTPDTNRKLLLLPSSTVQIPSKRNPSSPIKTDGTVRVQITEIKKDLARWEILPLTDGRIETGCRMDEIVSRETHPPPKNNHSESGSGLPRSASFSPSSDIEQPKHASPAQQDQFLAIMRHAQRGRMEEQCCSLGPSRNEPTTPKRNGSVGSTLPTGPDADELFGIIAHSQARRLDDQRVTLPALPGISATSDRRQNGSCAKDGVPGPTPNSILSEGTPAASRKAYPKPISSTAMTYVESGSSKAVPKSASFSPGSNSPAQVTLRVSMSFTPQQGRKNVGKQCEFPEVLLTLGAPGESLVVPLSPTPGRPLSLNLNLVPKESGDLRQCSPSHANPGRARRRPSSPNPGVCSRPRQGPAMPCQEEQRKNDVISPEDDCFSLIEKVHTAQLQKASAREKASGNPGRGKGKAEQGKGKGKGGGRKDRKDLL